MNSFKEIIETWPKQPPPGSPSKRATALWGFARDMEVRWRTAQMWVARDSIPADVWERLIVAAEFRGRPEITLNLLTKLYRERHKARRRRVVGNETELSPA